MTGKLILVRHQESEWNKVGRWTGIRDIHLSEDGFKRSNILGEFIKNLNLNIDNAFASMEVRTIETLSCILNNCELYNTPTKHAAELNERDYGEYTGKNKWEMEELLGEDTFLKIRRSWDFVPPKGESLKMVYDRAIPYYQKEILPLLNNNKNILIVGHGNSLRSLLKYIEDISDTDISEVEFDFNQVMIFDTDENGKKINKKILEVKF